MNLLKHNIINRGKVWEEFKSYRIAEKDDLRPGAKIYRMMFFLTTKGLHGELSEIHIKDMKDNGDLLLRGENRYLSGKEYYYKTIESEQREVIIYLVKDYNDNENEKIDNSVILQWADQFFIEKSRN